jgi:hypothetical protein
VPLPAGDWAGAGSSFAAAVNSSPDTVASGEPADKPAGIEKAGFTARGAKDEGFKKFTLETDISPSKKH